MDPSNFLFRSARSFLSGTLLSRLTGMARDLVMAFCFGVAPEVAAFMVAYRLANLFRRLFGESNLIGSFVPQFEEAMQESEKSAAHFYRDSFFAIVLALSAITIVGGCVCYGVSFFLAKDILHMMIIMMPGVMFLCLYALSSAVLQCQKRFFLPAMAPVAFNLVWIAAAFGMSGFSLKEAMIGLSFGILIAFMAQWWLTSNEVQKWFRSNAEKRAWFHFDLRSPRVKKLAAPLTLGIIGLGAAQINAAVDAIFARLADPSGPAFLWYAIRIQQLPLALVGVALSSALLPPLTRAIQSGLTETYQYLLQTSLRQSAALMIPSAFGLIVLADAGIDLLYGRGQFQLGDVHETALCLEAYAIGLVPMAFVMLLANGFYAKQDYRYPMRSSLISVGCNLGLNAIFVFGLHLGAISIALATSISAFVNCYLLSHRLGQQMKSLAIWRKLGRIVICSGGAALAAGLMDHIVTFSHDLVYQLQRFLLLALVFIGILAAFAMLLRVREITQFWKNHPVEEDDGAVSE